MRVEDVNKRGGKEGKRNEIEQVRRRRGKGLRECGKEVQREGERKDGGRERRREVSRRSVAG